MKTAIITGASSGIGREFALQASRRPNLDEIWLIARREEELRELQQSITIKSRVICLDLSKQESLDALFTMIESERPVIQLLVNAAGFGKFGSMASQTKNDVEDMVNVNIRALTSICKMCIDFMPSGSAVINMASISGYTPLPQLNVYAASKAYVLHFTQALAEELKEKNIAVTAVCPYWVASEFIPVAQRTAQGDAIDNFMLITYPHAVAEKAFHDNAMGKMLSLCGLVPKMIKCISRFMPVKCIFKIWNTVRKLPDKWINTSQYNPQFPAQEPLQ